MLGPLEWTQNFDDPGLGVSVRFARDRSRIVYELITPLGESSPVRRALNQRANLLNQLSYRTKSLEAAIRPLRAQGAVPLGTAAAAVAFGGARVQFLMMPLGFIVELIEIDRMIHSFSSSLEPPGP